MKKALCVLSFIFLPLCSQDANSEQVQALKKQFIDEISKKVTAELLNNTNQDETLNIVMEQATKQRALLAAASGAVDILQKLQDELENERKIAKNKNDKEKEKSLSKELNDVRQARNLLSRANKYVQEQAVKINKMFEDALKKNEELMNQAQEVIQTLIEK